MSPQVAAHVLIHRARIVRDAKSGAKDAQGERTTVPQSGPWFPARLMPRRPGNEEAREPGGRRRVATPWSLIYGDEHEDGTAIVEPIAEDVLEVERDLDAGTVVEQYEVAGAPAPFDAGDGNFGGQADLVLVKS